MVDSLLYWLKPNITREKSTSGQYGKVGGCIPYYIDKTRRQAANFSMDTLNRLINKCAEMDLAIKTGRIDGRLAMELLLMDMN